ncbi:unnamed protein product, partial [Musa textilis]
VSEEYYIICVVAARLVALNKNNGEFFNKKISKFCFSLMKHFLFYFHSTCFIF